MSGTRRQGRKDPPRSSQFKPGQSGNPRGRPRGKKNGPPFAAVFETIVALTQDGVPKKMTMLDALRHTWFKRGMDGDVLAARYCCELFATERKRAEVLDTVNHIMTIRFVRGSASSMLVTLKMAVKHDEFRDTVRYRLEPWIVEAALERMGDAKLSLAEQTVVWNATRTPRKVKWPEWWEYGR